MLLDGREYYFQAILHVTVRIDRLIQEEVERNSCLVLRGPRTFVVGCNVSITRIEKTAW
jgi:hypothetical protein